MITNADLDRIYAVEEIKHPLKPAEGIVNAILISALLWLCLAEITVLLVRAWDATQ